MTSLLEFEVIIGHAITTFPVETIDLLEGPIKNLNDKANRIHQRVSMEASTRALSTARSLHSDIFWIYLKNEAGRRFHVNSAVWDVLDYCEDILGTQSFCLLPELALARSSTSKESEIFGFEAKGQEKVVTYLTGVADYILWRFGMDRADVFKEFCASSCLILQASHSTPPQRRYII